MKLPPCAAAPLSSLGETSNEDELLATTASVYALYLLHTLQPSPPVPIPGLQDSYYRWTLLPGQSTDASWNPHVDVGRQKIKVEIDVLEKMMALPQRASAAMCLSREALHNSLATTADLTRDDDRLDFCADTRYVLRKLCGEEASADATPRRGSSAFHVLPHSRIRGIRNPPHLPVFADVSSEEKQKKEGRWGQLKPKVGGAHDAAMTRAGKTPIGLSRSDNLLIRAAEQLRQPLNASTLPLLAQTGAADQSTSYEFAQKDTATAWAGSWIEVPFRSKELPRRTKWEASQRDMERLNESYEQSKAEVAGASSHAKMLNIDLVKLMAGDTSWSGRSVDEQLQQTRQVPLTSAESIFEEARKLTGDTILRGMAKTKSEASQAKTS